MTEYTFDELKDLNIRKIKHGVLVYLTDEIIQNPEIAIMFSGEQSAFMIITQVFAEPMEKVKTIKYPSGWWQAFKFEYFPAWLLRWFPIIWTKDEIYGQLVYTELHKKCKLPNEKSTVVLHT